MNVEDIVNVNSGVTCEPYIVFFSTMVVIRFTKHLASCYNKRVSSFT